MKGTITVSNTAAAPAGANNTNKKVIFKICAPFTICISEINNTQVDNAKDIDIVMPMYNLIECSDAFNFKVKMAGQTGDDGTKNVEIMVPIKYLSNFWRTLEMTLINCEFNLILTWSERCAIVSTNVANQNTKFAITDTKLYVPVITLSQQDNAKLLQQLKSGFKIVINWNKYLSKPELLAPNPNLNP